MFGLLSAIKHLPTLEAAILNCQRLCVETPDKTDRLQEGRPFCMFVAISQQLCNLKNLILLFNPPCLTLYVKRA